MDDLGRRGGAGDWQPQDDQMVLEKCDEVGGQVTAQQDNSLGGVKTAGHVADPACVQTVDQAVQVLEILIKRGPGLPGNCKCAGTAGLHSVQRSCVRDGEFMQVMLEFAVGAELQSTHDPHHGGGIGFQVLGQCANAQQNKRARVLEYRTDDFLASRAQQG